MRKSYDLQRWNYDTEVMMHQHRAEMVRKGWHVQDYGGNPQNGYWVEYTHYDE